MESVFEAFISNPALYSAGHLVGETLHFPTNTEEVQSLLKRIGVDGVRCQEYFIISFDSDILGLYDYLGEYENIDELNHLAHLLKELSPSERETLEAVMDSGQHCGSVQDLINLTQNLDCYDFHPGVDNEEMLGRLYVEDMESLEVPDNIKRYFDFEAYGRDISINENGHFAPGGYVTKVSDDFREVYHGPQDIPAGHRVFAYPQLSIREQMAAYQEIIDGSSKEGFRRSSLTVWPAVFMWTMPFTKPGRTNTCCFSRRDRRMQLPPVLSGTPAGFWNSQNPAASPSGNSSKKRRNSL